MNSGLKLLLDHSLQTPLQQVKWAPLDASGINFFIKREDLVSTTSSGNKFYKLFLNIEEAKKQGHTKLFSYGGAYSNHLYALAHVGKKLGYQTVGVIRGERPAKFGATLSDLESLGMELVFVSRKQYRDKSSAVFEQALFKEYGDGYLIPEGGANELGAAGCQVISQSIDRQFKSMGQTNSEYEICLASGTGSTTAGVLAGAAAGLRVNAFSVLKGAESMSDEVKQVARKVNPLTQGTLVWHTDFHLGGYAKVTPELLDMMRDFEAATGILLDPVYTAKALWGICKLLSAGTWKSGTNLILIHTGGLQGRRGYNL